MEIRDFIVKPDTTLVDVMRRMDETAQGILYVCDQHDRLLGSITDGDVRRAIIASGKLDMLASDVMKKDPIAVVSLEKDTVGHVMNRNVIRSVPIIDNENRIIDISFINEYNGLPVAVRKIDVPVVIMAGGKGVRLQPYTNILPKPLIPIGEKTITEHILERFINAGSIRFSMIVNYKKHLIEAYFQDNDVGINIDFVEESEFLGTAGGLKLLKNRFKEAFFVTNCDILVEADYYDIYDYHKRSRNIATVVCAVKNMKLPYGVVSSTKTGRVTGIKEKPDISSIVNTGLYVLEPDFLEKIPSGEESQITDIFQKCIDDDLRIGMYPVSEDSWMDMGQLDELKKMTERLEDLK